MKIETYIVDAFTDKPFHGNPAGVCLLEEPITIDQMSAIAKELNLSETAFVIPLAEENKFSIRYFSPKMEIPLCGHATLASSKVLFEKNNTLKQIQFYTIQQIELAIEQIDHQIMMLFPVYNTEPMEAPKALINALGLPSIINSVFNKETNILLLEIEDVHLLNRLQPDFVQLKKSHDSINGVLVSAKSIQENYDFESRYFWPWSGTNEDPVTGGTHTFLAPYWSKRLNKSKMRSFQCSERTGFMEVELISSDQLIIKSQAQIILSGFLNI